MSQKAKSPAKPRYLQVCDELVAMIREGQVKVGDMLPTELELCDRFNISRHTAREALRRIENMGLVERRRGSGTRVTAQRAAVVYNQFVESLDELLQYGQATRLTIDKTQYSPVPPELADDLGREPGEKVIHLTGVRSQRDEVPPQALCVTDIWIPRAGKVQARHLLDLDQCERALYRLLDFSRLSRVKQTLSADDLSEESARKLDAEPGSASLVISRRYFDLGNRLILLAISTHPRDRFRYSTELAADRRHETGN